jgi:GT2 family glycosyltransferase
MDAPSEANSYRAIIHTRPAGEKRPLWSVMIPTYNCAQYLRETLKSVLSQDPGRETMQIQIVDDCSTKDDPRSVVAEMGGSRVEFHQQSNNVGLSRNFNTCLQRARGQLVHVLHGDDCVRPGFYEHIQRALNDNTAAGAAFCRYISMDESGHWLSVAKLEQPNTGLLSDWLQKIATGQRLQTPCMVVRREVYESLGGFDRRLSYGEDWEMWVRIAASYPVAYVPEPLALYRVHSVSSTARGILTGDNGRDLRRAIAVMGSYLPPALARSATRQARKAYARACIRRGHRALDAGDQAAIASRIRDALKTDLSLGVAAKAAYLWLRSGAKFVFRRLPVRLSRSWRS